MSTQSADGDPGTRYATFEEEEEEEEEERQVL